jgi:hypothetical protein
MISPGSVTPKSVNADAETVMRHARRRRGDADDLGEAGVERKGPRN